MSDYGIKITIDGEDVSTTDPRKYVFNSAYGTVKIASEPPNKAYQTIVVPAGGSATVSIAHGLSFAPMVMLFTELKPGSGHWYCGGLALASPGDLSGSVIMDSDISANTYVDSTYIKIKYINSGGSDLTVKYYYFIFGDDSA